MTGARRGASRQQARRGAGPRPPTSGAQRRTAERRQRSQRHAPPKPAVARAPPSRAPRDAHEHHPARDRVRVRVRAESDSESESESESRAALLRRRSAPRLAEPPTSPAGGGSAAAPGVATGAPPELVARSGTAAEPPPAGLVGGSARRGAERVGAASGSVSGSGSDSVSVSGSASVSGGMVLVGVARGAARWRSRDCRFGERALRSFSPFGGPALRAGRGGPRAGPPSRLRRDAPRRAPVTPRAGCAGLAARDRFAGAERPTRVRRQSRRQSGLVGGSARRGPERAGAARLRTRARTRTRTRTRARIRTRTPAGWCSRASRQARLGGARATTGWVERVSAIVVAVRRSGASRRTWGASGRPPVAPAARRPPPSAGHSARRLRGSRCARPLRARGAPDAGCGGRAGASRCSWAVRRDVGRSARSSAGSDSDSDSVSDSASDRRFLENPWNGLRCPMLALFAGVAADLDTFGPSSWGHERPHPAGRPH